MPGKLIATLLNNIVDVFLLRLSFGMNRSLILWQDFVTINARRPDGLDLGRIARLSIVSTGAENQLSDVDKNLSGFIWTGVLS